MSFTTTEVIEEVRELIQDTDATVSYRRFADAFILRKLNQGLRRFAILRPDLFATVAPLTCANGALQTAPADCIRLIDVLAASDGRALKEVDQSAIDLMSPTWEAGAPGIGENWMRSVRDPNRFYVYPPATTDEIITILYAKAPVMYALGDTVVLQDVYFPAVVDCTVWMMESVDAESVESGRAKFFKDSFMEMVTASLQSRKLTDTAAAGMDPKEVF